MAITFTSPDTLPPDEIEKGETFAPKFGPEGLVTAIAIEAGSGEVLMLGHMDAEALRLTLETGHVHYFSRSRHRIWKKGESSGELQELVELRTDCDQDAMLVIVRQLGHGAACHTGRKSCFFRKVELDADGARLTDLGDEPLFDPRQVYKK
jgi:phosphoribosyl-AMP cyclohydrolase